ncbi:StAR-related lipid transfer protein 7, mitochondrial [Orchesella cincta]|uniref:Phosphatidylcholine transfer protein n=1 Tax=Orchesella cincta TaxID=48709 RepID=A0A1D2NG84_ORCCI|nr:StAR-related lipid transfer protein 7, mitochondrial [Orchesella cincta]
MNGKISHLLAFRNQHHTPTRFNSSYSQSAQLKFVVEKLKREFPNTTNFLLNATHRLEYFRTLQKGFKMIASFIGRECSPIFAQRAFRSYRMLQLHSKLWSYNRSPVSKKALLSFVILSFCHANKSLKQSIEEEELNNHLNDLEFLHELTEATVVCPGCKDRLVVDKKIAGVEYCHCPGAKSAYNRKIDGYAWVPFVETPDLLVWRQPHPDLPGLFIYKVYGYYDDISAEDFLDVQLDIEYRKKWDDSALQLEIVEKDKESKSEVIYWEMQWPRMFSNRDYLFTRRHTVDKSKDNMVIMSRAMTHPNVPERKGVHRVTEYWSVMQIRGPRGLSQPGVEFGLTYFDNPGVSLPNWLTNWAAMTGIPDFLEKQRHAARIRRHLATVKSIAVSSQSTYSDNKKTKKSNNPNEQSTPSLALISSSSIVEAGGNKNIVSISSSDNSSENINSNNNLNTSTTTPSAPNSQQEGKNELLSQFFKEQILDVHS